MTTDDIQRTPTNTNSSQETLADLS